MTGARLLAALAMVAAILVLPAGAAELQVRFHEPAQAGPAVASSDATWVLIVFQDTEADFQVSLPEPSTEHNITYVGTVGTRGGLSNTSQPAVPYESSRGLPPMTVTAKLGQGRASFFMQGASLGVVGGGLRAELRPATDCLEGLLPSRASQEHEARFDRLCPRSGGGAVVLRPEQGEFGFQVTASGVDAVEWHHAATTCTASPCPGGGVRQDRQTPALGGEQAYNSLRGFTRLEGHNLTVKGDGRASYILVGGPGLDVGVQGWVRLPLASSSQACPGCLQVENQTLWMQGNVALHDLDAGPDGSMTAGLVGAPDAVRLDEATTSPDLLFGASAAVAAAALAVPLLPSMFKGLFSRVLPRDAANHPRRKALMELVQANPGIHLREVARRMGWGAAAVHYHAKVLERAGHLVARRHGRALCFFENHGRYGAQNQRAIAVLREGPLRELHAWLETNPAATRTAVVQHATLAWKWTRRTTYHRLNRLEAAGLVVGSKQRRARLTVVRLT